MAAISGDMRGRCGQMCFLSDQIMDLDGVVHFDGRERSLTALLNASERLLWERNTAKQPVSYFISRPEFIKSPLPVAYRARQRLEFG